MPHNTVQAAHDALLAVMPADAAHENCPLCGPGVDGEQEVAHVANEPTPAPAGNVYSEAQHFSLLESAVERETASVTAEKSALEAQVQTLESEKAAVAVELDEAKNRIDVLEAEKATAEAAAETARTELEDFKSETARQARVEELKSERTAAVKAANGNLADNFFTPERVTRWAEMDDEAFGALVTEMRDFAEAAKAQPASEPEEKTTEQARETADFSGGSAPTTTEGGTSTLASLLAVRQGRKTA
jgi:DNA repair exonuclease SbcCD ATPase subunit